MERWTTGHNLLATTYQGNEDEFFTDIEGGRLIPCSKDPIMEDIGGHRLFPPGVNKLRSKISQYEQLKRFLERTDDELIKQHFDHPNTKCGQENFDIFKAKNGKELLEILSRLRPEKEAEFEKLRREIGNTDEALLPAAVWRGVTVTTKIREMLLEARYLVGDEVLESSAVYKEWVYITKREYPKKAACCLSTFKKRVNEAVDIDYDLDQEKKGAKRLRENDLFSIINQTYRKEPK